MINMVQHGFKYSELSGYEAWWREDAHRSAVVTALPHGTRYILFVTDGDEIVAPDLLEAVRGDRCGYYNALNVEGHGYRYLEMELLVYGLRYKQLKKWFLGFMATDRVVRGLQGTHGHLATLTTSRFQVPLLSES
jgi:hypothetical protein